MYETQLSHLNGFFKKLGKGEQKKSRLHHHTTIIPDWYPGTVSILANEVKNKSSVELNAEYKSQTDGVIILL